MAIPLGYILYCAADITVGVIAFLGNTLMLVIMYHYRYLLKKNIFLTSMVIADLLTSLMIPPVAFITMLRSQCDFYSCVLVFSLLAFFINASLLSVCLMAVDRFLIIVHPECRLMGHYGRDSAWAQGLAWALSLLVSFTPLLYNRKAHYRGSCVYREVIPIEYNVYIHFLGFTLPVLLAMLGLHALTYYSFARKMRRVTTKPMAPPLIYASMMESRPESTQLSTPYSTQQSTFTSILSSVMVDAKKILNSAIMSVRKAPCPATLVGPNQVSVAPAVSRDLLPGRDPSPPYICIETRVRRLSLDQLPPSTPFNSRLRVRANELSAQPSQTSLARRNLLTGSVLKSLVFIFLIYLVCRTPLDISNTYRLASGLGTTEQFMIELSFLVLSHLSCLVNPILFCLPQKAFRTAILQFFRRTKPRNRQGQNKKALKKKKKKRHKPKRVVPTCDSVL